MIYLLFIISKTHGYNLPHPQIRQLPPQQLTPMTTLSWEYLTPGPLAVSGIYSEKDIEKL